MVGLEGLHELLVLNTEESSIYTASDIKVVRMNPSLSVVLKLWVGGHIKGFTSRGSRQGGQVKGVVGWPQLLFIYMYEYVYSIYKYV